MYQTRAQSSNHVVHVSYDQREFFPARVQVVRLEFVGMGVWVRV